MIGSFWNLCRACPSMPIDNLHSEYRSTYRWHEFTGHSRPDVVQRAPLPHPTKFIGPTNEPPLPRRKKCPALAYKSSEFIIGEDKSATLKYNEFRMGRPENRGTHSRRCKSEGPTSKIDGNVYRISTEIDGTSSQKAGESNGLFEETISKLTTEYRFQFVWPNVRRLKGHASNDVVDHSKKSVSIGTIQVSQKQGQQNRKTVPTIPKKPNLKEAALQELEPLVDTGKVKTLQDKQVSTAEKNCGAFDLEKNNILVTRLEKFGFDKSLIGTVKETKKDVILVEGIAPPNSQPDVDLWFKEVIELRKKAGQYKFRGWGIEIDPEMYKNQTDLWERVSRRSSLSALSLASSVHRNYTKEEKEKENQKKIVPLHTQKTPLLPAQSNLGDVTTEITNTLPTRGSYVRHHLGRTTGFGEEGPLIPSPTREKLIPAVIKREIEQQKVSPRHLVNSRQGSPQKLSPQKASLKKIFKNSTEKEYDTSIKAPCSKTTVQQEPLIKSPPEPTRVKSPEQIIMRSPEPVNWIVPLDTGKTFTVTQNVKQGESHSRPQSEIKATISMEKMPPPPQSAPPELTKEEHLHMKPVYYYQH